VACCAKSLLRGCPRSVLYRAQTRQTKSSRQNRMNAWLGRQMLAMLACTTSLMSSHEMLAEQASNPLSSAVDAKGVRHSADDYVGHEPWVVDAIKKVTPEYPYTERALRHTGSGLIRVTLDLTTGSVLRATVIKSTGFAALDSSAADAFRRWRWKPGKWKEIDIPVTFTFSGPGPRFSRAQR
jgi:TonB family protein